MIADLRPLMEARPIADFPQAWSRSLLTMQDFAGGFWGMPYHDGPQCLIDRTDLLAEAGVERLFEVMDAMSAEAERRGLTDEILDEELAAHNAERRGPAASPKP